MFDALKSHWQDLSDNFYGNWQGMKLLLFTAQYAAVTGDYETLENLILLHLKG